MKYQRHPGNFPDRLGGHHHEIMAANVTRLQRENAELRARLDFAATCIETAQGHCCNLCADYLREAAEAAKGDGG